jgi:hypothetical protein
MELASLVENIPCLMVWMRTTESASTLTVILVKSFFLMEPAKFCESWTHPDSEAKNCIKDSCDYQREILTITGTCTDCEDYTRPGEPDSVTGDRKECISDTCALGTEIKKIDGTCETCAVYFHPDLENKNCIQCDRQEGEIIQTNGTCRACPERTYVGPMLHECIPVDCEPGEIEVLGDTSIDGAETWCEECEDYTLPNADGNACVDPACPSDSIKHRDGTCEKCPDFYGPDESFTECVQEPCDGNEIIQRSNGKCKQCDMFYFPNEDRKECI